MLIFIVFFNLTLAVASLCLHENAAEILMPIHRACLARLTGNEQSAIYQAMVCGEKIHEHPILEPLKVLGMQMLVSSSGSHLWFFEFWVRWITQRIEPSLKLGFRSFFWPMAILFVCLNLLSAVAVRVALLFLLRDLNRTLKLNWTETQLITTAGLCALPFCHSVAHVTGLLVGWSASLALAAYFSRKKSRRFGRQLRLYLLLLPVLIPFSVPHPLSILAHVLLMPFAGFALMGASLAVAIVPRLAPFVDATLSVAEKALLALVPYLPHGLAPLKLPFGTLAAYVGALTFWTWNLERRIQCKTPLS